MKELPSFDELRKMAVNDPKALEALRQEMVNEVIDNAPKEKQAKLKGLQFKIDAKIKTSRTPFESMGKIYDEMMDSFEELNEKLNLFTRSADGLQNDLKNLSNKEGEIKKEPVLKIVKEK